MKLPKDIKKWSPERVFQYMTQELKDENYKSICQLLYDFPEREDTLFNVIQNDQELAAWYPMTHGDFPYEDSTIIGEIMDGWLYIKPNEKNNNPN